MMIKLTGVLSLRMITGRNGDFRVGRLVTDIGEFAVKDAVLDQYDEGRYEGEFGVNRIFPSHYSAGGRLVVEVRAELSSIALSRIDLEEQQEALLEQDPLEEEKTPSAIGKPDASRVRKNSKAASESSKHAIATADAFEAPEQPALPDDTADHDATLFGLLWPLGEQLKLDPTVDRNVFRQQRDRLKALGYRFIPVGQQWVKQ